jgi:tetratricopeptide (TPR) repeat protein
MRIECEKCNAAFTIGDSLLSDQPIGAQCPYCGHVRVVSKNDGIPGGRASAPPPSGLPPFEQDPLGGRGPGLQVLPPVGGQELGWGPGSVTQQSAAPSFMTQAGAAPAIDGGSSKCQVCGIPLVDEFDKVIGLCEQHQRERGGQTEFPAQGQGGGGGRGPSLPPGAEGTEWRVRTSDGNLLGPFSLAEVRTRIQREELGTDDQYARDSGDFAHLSTYPELKNALPRSAAGSELATLRPTGRPKKTETQARQQPKESSISFGTLFGIVILLGMIGAGYWAFDNPDEVKKIYTNITQQQQAPAPLPTNPLKRVLAKWRLAQPDVSGTAGEHLVTARARYLEDTWRGYQIAQDALKRALLLDEENPIALAAYVENLIVWRDKLLTDEELKTAQAAVKFAQSRKPDDPNVLRALAEVDFVRGDLAGARAFAEKAVEKDAKDGQAHLMLAQSYLEGNVALAIQEGEAATKAMPNLRRADRFLARAYANAGRYGSAIKIVAERAKVDPSNSAVHRLYGDIERELANLDAARKHYVDAINSDGDVLAARLSLGELQLETGDAAGALDVYQRVLKATDAPLAYRVTALGGSARAEILRGHNPKALEFASQALALQPRDSVALVTKGELLLETGSVTTAQALGQRANDVRSGEPAALVLLGRAAVQEKRSDQAVRYLEEAINNDGKDPRLHAILGGAYLAFGGASQAFTVMRHAAEIDPLERTSRNRKGLLAISVLPLRETIERYKKAADEPRNRSVAYSSVALIEYQMGEFGKAKEAIDESLRADDSNLTALIYAAQLDLERGAPDKAIELTRRILEIDRGSAMGHLIVARALQQQNRLVEAKEEYSATLRSAPGMLIATVEIAGIQLKTGANHTEALDALTRAHQVYPHILRTRQLLYGAGL